MKLISLISCIFLILLATANAEEILKCIDSHGNTVFTTTPQDGMKCFKEESEAESQKQPSNVNLIDKCDKFAGQLDNIKDDMAEIEKKRDKLYKELRDIQKNCYERHCYDGNTDVEESNANYVSKELDKLYDKYDDMESYKCNQLKTDLERLNQSTSHSTNRKGRYRNR
jgi:hypothetical protein